MKSRHNWWHFPFNPSSNSTRSSHASKMGGARQHIAPKPGIADRSDRIQCHFSTFSCKWTERISVFFCLGNICIKSCHGAAPVAVLSSVKGGDPPGILSCAVMSNMACESVRSSHVKITKFLYGASGARRLGDAIFTEKGFPLWPVGIIRKSHHNILPGESNPRPSVNNLLRKDGTRLLKSSSNFCIDVCLIFSL